MKITVNYVTEQIKMVVFVEESAWMTVKTKRLLVERCCSRETLTSPMEYDLNNGGTLLF